MMPHHWRPLAHERNSIFKCKQHTCTLHDPWGPEKYDYTMMNEWMNLDCSEIYERKMNQFLITLLFTVTYIKWVSLATHIHDINRRPMFNNDSKLDFYMLCYVLVVWRQFGKLFVIWLILFGPSCPAETLEDAALLFDCTKQNLFPLRSNNHYVHVSVRFIILCLHLVL